jgi:tRNA-intron endonuclease
MSENNDATAVLLEESSLIEDESNASRIHNKGYFGTPRSGGGLELDLIETAYLSESDKVTVVKDKEEITGEQLFIYCNKLVTDFETKFLVYRDLRSRGLVTKPTHPCTFKTYPRSSVPGKTPSDLWVDVVSERDGFVLPELFERADLVVGLRKKYVLAIVDEEGDLTYYEVERRTPKGKYPPSAELGKGKGLVVGDKVLVWNQEFAKVINGAEFYGKQVSSKALGLSLFEADYLMSMGTLEIHNEAGPISTDAFNEHANGIEPDFSVISAVYSHLKGSGLLVKTGFKYGSHFRAYKDDPESSHSQYLVWAAKADYRSTWPEIGRAIRLAHTVNKDFLIAGWDGKKVDYLGISRVKP